MEESLMPGRMDLFLYRLSRLFPEQQISALTKIKIKLMRSGK